MSDLNFFISSPLTFSSYLGTCTINVQHFVILYFLYTIIIIKIIIMKLTA